MTITRYQTRIKKNGNWKMWSGKDPQPNLNNWISRSYQKLSPNTKYKVQVPITVGVLDRADESDLP